MGFPHKIAYITAAARVTLYGWHAKYHVPSRELDPVTTEWIAWHKNRVTTEDELRQTYFNIVTDLAFHLLQNEIETAMAERTGIVPSFDCMKTWIQIYETIHTEELGRHRTDLTLDVMRESERDMI